jgi:hypothetical protein
LIDRSALHADCRRALSKLLTLARRHDGERFRRAPDEHNRRLTLLESSWQALLGALHDAKSQREPRVGRLVVEPGFKPLVSRTGADLAAGARGLRALAEGHIGQFIPSLWAYADMLDAIEIQIAMLTRPGENKSRENRLRAAFTATAARNTGAWNDPLVAEYLAAALGTRLDADGQRMWRKRHARLLTWANCVDTAEAMAALRAASVRRSR